MITFHLRYKVILLLALCAVNPSYAMQPSKELIEEIAEDTTISPVMTRRTIGELAAQVQWAIATNASGLDGGPCFEGIKFVPLIIAASCKDPKFVEWLLDRGASRNVSTDFYKSPLHAVLNVFTGLPNDEAIVKARQSFYMHPQINSQETIVLIQLSGKKPLIKAAQSRNLKLAERCLEYGLNPNAQDEDGRTALMHALGHEAYAIVELLFKYGVDPKVLDNRGQTAQDYIQHQSCSDELKKQVKESVPLTDMHIPLHYRGATEQAIAHADILLAQFSRVLEAEQQTAEQKALDTHIVFKEPGPVALKKTPKKKSTKRGRKGKRSKDLDSYDEEFFPVEIDPQEPVSFDDISDKAARIN